MIPIKIKQWFIRDPLPTEILDLPDVNNTWISTTGIYRPSQPTNKTTTSVTAVISSGIATALNVSNSIGSYIGVPQYNSAAAYTLYDPTGKEIVRLEKDGSVVWAGEIDIDFAADAFSKAMTLGAELAAGIKEATKRKIRDKIFEEIISIAKDKGHLSADELTYLLEASKIIEKLNGLE